MSNRVAPAAPFPTALPIADRLSCGVVLAGQTPQALVDQARRAEALGFDSLWVGDHLAFHVPIPDSLSVLSFVAGATERVTLGTAVYLLPLRPAALAAKTAATLDWLSGGRLVLGVGVGGEFPPEWEAAGVPLRERGSRLDEAMPLLRRLWSEDGVVHAGRHARFGPVTIAPKPVRPGGPPLWVGGRAPAAMRRAGRLGDGYISHMTTAEKYAENLRVIEDAAREAGREAFHADGFSTAAFLFTVLGPYEEARARATALLGTIYRRDFREAAPRYCLLGQPDDCLEQLDRFARSGARHFILVPLMDALELTERAGADLLPRL